MNAIPSIHAKPIRPDHFEQISSLIQDYAEAKPAILSAKASDSNLRDTYLANGYQPITVKPNGKFINLMTSISAINQHQAAIITYFDPLRFKLSTSQANLANQQCSAQKTWPEFFEQSIHSLESIAHWSIGLDPSGHYLKSQWSRLKSAGSNLLHNRKMVVSPLIDTITNEPTIICNAHLDRFDNDGRKNDITSMIALLEQICLKYSSYPIIVVGKLHPSTHNGVNHPPLQDDLLPTMRQTLNPSTVQIEHASPSYLQSYGLQAAYFIPATTTHNTVSIH